MFYLHFFSYSIEFTDVVGKDEIKKKYRDVIFVEDDDGSLRKYVLYKPNVRPTRTAKAPPPPPPPQPKPYEILAASMPNCSVALVQLSENDIQTLKEKMKREFKAQRIEKKLKSLPVLKICDFVRFSMIIEADIKFVNGDIAFESISDNSLKLMEQYIFADENPIFDLIDDAFYAPNESDYDSTIMEPVNAHIYNEEIDPFIELFVGSWFNMEILGANVMNSNDGEFSNAIKLVAQFDWSFKLHNDGNLIIQLPELDGNRTSLTISKQVWRHFFNQMFVHNEFGSSVEFAMCDGNMVIRLPEIDGKRSTLIISNQVWFNFIAAGLSSRQFLVGNNIVDAELLEKSFSSNWFQEQSTPINISIDSDTTSTIEIDTSAIAETSGTNITSEEEMLAKLFASNWFLGAESSMSIDCSAGDRMEIVAQDSINDQTMLSVSSSLSF